MKKGSALALLGVCVTLTSLLSPAALVTLSFWPGALARAAPLAAAGPALLAILAAPAALHTLLSLLLWLRARAMPRGQPGRARAFTLGGAGIVCGVSSTIAGSVLPYLLAPLPKIVLTSATDAWLSFPERGRMGLALAAGVGGTALLVVLVSAISLWFLLPPRPRRLVFLGLDLALLVATSWLWYRFLGAPKSDREGARLVLTFLLGARLGVRLLPLALDQIERIGFRALVAARLLRAKKSGFLAAISGLSILAVTVSSCALTTTLSVMGGFRQDLKRKILGNTAHIVIDREKDEPISGYQELTEQVLAGPEVTGVSPYVSGEVMISSASNLAGAVLRGIDPNLVRTVSEIDRNIERTGIGSLDYLLHPEKLTQLSVTQLSLGVGGPKVTHHATDADAPAGSVGRLSADLDAFFEETGKPAARQPEEEEESAPTKPDVLPGIIVGRELARSLRLYLGDEVNVVTPLGELGPAGPMPKARPFRVAGVFYSGMYEYDMKLTYVTLDAAQKFFGLGDMAHGIEITVKEPERSQEVAQWTMRQLARPELRVRPWQELNKNLFGALALEKLAMFIALGIAILVASFCIVGTLTLMVQEKGREVAVLKAMGASDQAIVGVFVLEGTLIGCLGSVLGLALGYVMCFGAERFGIRLNPEVYYIDRLPVNIDAAEFLAVGLAAVLVCLCVTIYPALLASRLRPVDALRYE